MTEGEIDRQCNRFEAAWQQALQPRLEDYVTDPADGGLFLELLKVDLSYRRRQQESPRPDEYVARFPDHAAVIYGCFGSEVTCSVAKLPVPAAFTTIGRYRVERLLGRGAFGNVHLAHDDQLQRHVAIKTPHRDRSSTAAELEDYLTEARTIAGLDHPHIVPVFDIGSTLEFPLFIVSKFIDGSDLAVHLLKEPVSQRSAAEIIAQVGDALHYAHSKGIVHRDLKPSNILLDRRLTPLVADFGIALLEAEYGNGTSFAGTPAYMSPEQARGEGDRVDGRSDVFSMGLIFYELLTGKRPFRGDTVEKLLESIRTADPRPPRQVNDSVESELERICLKSLAKRTGDRYTTAKDMSDELRNWLALTSTTVAIAERTMSISQAAEPRAAKLESNLQLGNLGCSLRMAISLVALLVVTLGGLSTHPEVWKRIQPTVGFDFPPPSPQSITAPEFRARLVEAEKRLHNDEDLTLAVSDFRNLYSQLPHISELNEKDRVDTYLGLARALAGNAEKIDDPELREKIKPLLDNLAGATALTDKQRIQSDYLHLVVLGDVSIPATSPDDVEGALTNWELELSSIKVSVPNSTALEKLLMQVATHRRSKNFSLARARLEELRTKLQVEPDPVKLNDQADLEELHLNLSESSDDPTHLQKLDEFLRVKIAAEKQLLDRARLLRLLVVSKAQPSPATFLSPTVIPALVELGLEPFPESRTLQSTYQFAPDEAASLLSVKTQITDEFVQSPVVTTPAALSVFTRLYKKDDAAKHLCDRLEYLLKQPLTAEQLVVIQNAAANLQTFVEKQKPWDSLSSVKRLPLEKKDADLRLQVALIGDAPASDTEISGLVGLVARSSDPGKGVQQLIDNASQPGWTKVVVPLVRELLAHPALKSASSRDVAKWRSQLEKLQGDSKE